MSAPSRDADVGTFRRLRATPLRDVLRGRISGRLSPDVLCRNAGLPAPIREVVTRTARRTRLFRSERAEVARELIAHFGDGLDSGRGPDELVRSFGNTTTAARLIRRAKKRDRALHLKLAVGSVKAFGVFVLALILTYAVLAARYYTARPGPITDYAARVNAAALAVPEGEHAWPVYREALLTPGFREGARELTSGVRPGWRDWPETRAFLLEHAETVETIRRGAGLEGFGFVLGTPLTAEDRELWPDLEVPEASSTTFGLVELLLPTMGEFRPLARVLHVDALLALEQNDHDRVAANILALVRMAEQARETPFLINDLVGMSVAALACETAARIIHDHPGAVSAEILTRIAHAIAAFPSDGEPLVRIRGERMIFEDAVQRMYSLDSDGDGVLAAGAMERLSGLTYGNGLEPDLAERAAGPVVSAISAGRKETLAFYNDYAAKSAEWIRTPAWERKPFDDTMEAIDSPLLRTRYALAHALTPSYVHAYLNAERFETSRDATLCAIAIERHRRDHGGLPSSLSDLTPRYIPKAPIDPFSGEPIGYRVDGDSFVLYSVANDYDDDGGRIPDGADEYNFANAAGRWIARESVRSGEASRNAGQLRRFVRSPAVVDGDWILFPPPELKEPAPVEEIPM